jgi:D-alanyl-lipoteichoic acid acyltransferase DltB (MBOAT superfamily)
MLFTSFRFLFLFLPITYGIYWWLNDRNRAFSFAWLILASFCFYAFYNPYFPIVLLISVLLNYGIGRLLDAAAGRERLRLLLIGSGLVGNVFLLGFFKYGNFFIAIAGLSFYTFVQIQYLFDVYNEITSSFSFLDYLLSVCFFPYLVAGPIVNPSEIVAQFADKKRVKPDTEELSRSLMLFAIGLFKKIAIADSLSHWVDPLFQKASAVHRLSFSEAWFGALLFTFELYFDFSGYSDMAIGIAGLFGVRLPVNFNSPYKASTIIDFWQRWHMTLTRFLTGYIYNPIALIVARRRAAAAKPIVQGKKTTLGAYLSIIFFPTVFTMAIAGIWHGAGWTFLIFGILHGVYLAVCHGWHLLRDRLQRGVKQSRRPATVVSNLFTFLCVVVSFVFFRSTTITAANGMLMSMVSLDSISSPNIESVWKMCVLGVLFAVVWLCPNSQQICGQDGSVSKNSRVSFGNGFLWRPNSGWAILHGCMFALTLWMVYAIARPADFIYFKF